MVSVFLYFASLMSAAAGSGGAASAPAERPTTAQPWPMVRVPQLKARAVPGIDFSQAPWDRAARVAGFLQIGGEKPAVQPTWVYLFYDPASLWVGFRSEGTGAGSPKTEVTEPDEKIWRDDSIECLFSPTGVKGKAFQFVLNAAGVLYDAVDEDKSWDAKLRVQTTKDDKGWSAVMSIPFAQLKMGVPRPGSAWGANFSRNSSLPERSTWSSVLKSFLEPQRFGRIIFAGDAGEVVRLRQVDPMVIGPNALLLDSLPDGACRLSGLDRRGNLISSRQERMPRDGSLHFALGDDRVRQVDLAIVGRDETVLARMRYPLQSPEVAERVKQLNEQLAAVRKMLPKFSPQIRPAAEAIVARVRASIDDANKTIADPSRHSAANWTRLDKVVRDVQLQLDGPACHARTLERLPDAEFAVGLESSMRQVMIRDFPFAGRIDDHYDLSLARNEHEGFQVAVIPFSRDLKDVTVSVGAISGKGTAWRFNGKTQVSLVGHVEVADDPPYDTDYHGWWPDPLLDFQQKCDAKAGDHVAFWIDVATAPDTPAGDYQGTIQVSAAGTRPITLRLNVHVWDFELPKGTHLRNAFTYHHSEVHAFYRDRWSDELARRYHDFVLDHRLNIDHLYRADAPRIDLLKYGFARGMNAFNVGAAFRDVVREKRIARNDQYVAELKKAKLFDYAYVYGFDEVRKEKFEEVREVFGEIRRNYPGLKTMTTAVDPSFGLKTGLRGVVDIWVPLTDWYDLDEAKRLRREGKEMWWYICVVPTHPYANWFIEYPAIESRLLLGAMTFKYQSGGFLYYLLNQWRGNRKPITSGPYTDWNAGSFVNEEKKYTANGDGNLMCPGPDGPLSTIRLENIRDGIEDYEYLYLLRDISRQLAKKTSSTAATEYLKKVDRLLAVPDVVVNTLIDYTREPQDLNSFRTTLAEAIIEGKSLLSK